MIRCTELRLPMRLIDTGATLLGMDEKFIDQLGLEQIGTGRAKTTSGLATFGIYGP